MKQQLDLGAVERVEKRVGGTTALVVIDPLSCPVCGGALTSVIVEAPMLFRHGGYGATKRTTTVFCEPCRWRLVRDVSEVRPV